MDGWLLLYTLDVLWFLWVYFLGGARWLLCRSHLEWVWLQLGRPFAYFNPELQVKTPEDIKDLSLWMLGVHTLWHFFHDVLLSWV